MRIRAYIAGILFAAAGIAFILFTKHSEVIYLGESGYCFNYGFPLRCFITDPDNCVIHVYAENIFLDILFLLPVFLPVALCLCRKNFSPMDHIFAAVFCSGAALTVFLPWRFKSCAFVCASTLYGLGIVRSVFCVIRLALRRNKKKDRSGLCVIILSLLPYCAAHAEDFRVLAEMPDRRLTAVPEAEKTIREKLKKDNPRWDCTSESFSLFSTQLGLNIMIAGPEIADLAALNGFDFDTVILRNTSVCDTRFLEKSKSLRVLAVLNDKDNLREIDLSSLRGKNIRTLALVNVQVQDCSPVKNMKFRMLRMENVGNVDLSEFSGLSELESLTAVGMKMKDTGFFRNCRKLRYLDFDGVKLSPALYALPGSRLYPHRHTSFFGKVTWGFCDAAGKVKTPHTFRIVTLASGGLAVGCRGDGKKFLLKNGVECGPFPFDDICPYPENGIFWTQAFSEGFAVVKKNGKWGYVNDSLQTVIKPEFDEAANFSEGLARVKKNGKWGYIDRRGNLICGFLYDKARSFRNGLAVVTRDGKSGAIDAAGKEVLPLRYDCIGHFSCDLFPVSLKGGGWFFVNSQGKRAFPGDFSFARSFSHGTAVVTDRNGKFGAVNPAGKTVIPFAYDDLSNFTGRFYAYGKKSGDRGLRYGFLDGKGRLLSPPLFTAADPVADDIFLLARKIEIHRNPERHSTVFTPTDLVFAKIAPDGRPAYFED